MTKTDLVVYAYFLAPFFSAQFSFPTYNNGTPVPKAGIIRAVWLLFASLIELPRFVQVRPERLCCGRGVPRASEGGTQLREAQPCQLERSERTCRGGGSRGRSPWEIFALTVCTNANVRSDHSEPRTQALNMLSEWTIFTREVAIFSHRHRHPGKKKISKKKATVTQASQVVPHPSTD